MSRGFPQLSHNFCFILVKLRNSFFLFPIPFGIYLFFVTSMYNIISVRYYMTFSYTLSFALGVIVTYCILYYVILRTPRSSLWGSYSNFHMKNKTKLLQSCNRRTFFDNCDFWYSIKKRYKKYTEYFFVLVIIIRTFIFLIRHQQGEFISLYHYPI